MDTLNLKVCVDTYLNKTTPNDRMKYWLEKFSSLSVDELIAILKYGLPNPELTTLILEQLTFYAATSPSYLVETMLKYWRTLISDMRATLIEKIDLDADTNKVIEIMTNYPQNSAPFFIYSCLLIERFLHGKLKDEEKDKILSTDEFNGSLLVANLK